jgi:hypothetical protein
VLRDVAVMVAVGVTIGSIAAAMTTGLARSLLYDLTPTDPAVFAEIASCAEIFGLQNHKLSSGLTVGGQPRRLGFSQHGAIGAIANMAGFVTFVR